MRAALGVTVLALLACSGAGDPPLPSPAPVPREAPRPARHAKAHPTGRDGATCETRADCASDHCCLTPVGAVCAASCTYDDVRFVVLGEVCTSDAECPGQTCGVTATAGARAWKTCR